MKNSTFFILLVLTLALSMFSLTSAEEQVTLEVALTSGRNPNQNIVQDYGDISWTTLLVEAFQKEYPHVDVEFRTSNMDQVTVMLMAGIGPDIINGTSTAFINLGMQDAFIDLLPLLQRDGIDVAAEQMYWPPQLSAYEYKGKLFALPQYLGTIGMVYNADMFGEMGLNDPEPSISNTMDWDEFEDMAKKLTRDTTGDGIIDVYGFDKRLRTNRVYYWLKAAGAQFYADEARTQSALNSPEAIRALEYLRSLRWDAQVMAPPGASVSWTAGDVAIQEQGSWALVDYLGMQSDGTSKIPFEWNVFPMPIGPSGERATMGTIDAYGINKHTEHPEEAYALLKFLTGPEANEILAKYLALQPAHRDIVPQYLGLIQDLNTDVRSIHAHVFTDAGPYAHPQLLYANQEVASSIINEAYNKIFEENQPAGPIWSEAIERLNRALAANVTSDEQQPDHLDWYDTEWLSEDFNTALAGSATATGNDLFITASGKDIWGNQDGFRYVYRQVKGNFTATVKMRGAPDTDDWSKAGIMLRTEATSGAANVAVLGTYNKGAVMQIRPRLAQASQTAARTDWDTGAPVYVRIARRGNEVSGAVSRDGETWRLLTTVTLDLPEAVLVGPALTSHAQGALGEAVFSDWTLQQVK